MRRWQTLSRDLTPESLCWPAQYGSILYFLLNQRRPHDWNISQVLSFIISPFSSPAYNLPIFLFGIVVHENSEAVQSLKLVSAFPLVRNWDSHGWPHSSRASCPPRFSSMSSGCSTMSTALSSSCFSFSCGYSRRVPLFKRAPSAHTLTSASLLDPHRVSLLCCPPPERFSFHVSRRRRQRSHW